MEIDEEILNISIHLRLLDLLGGKNECHPRILAHPKEIKLSEDSRDAQSLIHLLGMPRAKDVAQACKSRLRV